MPTGPHPDGGHRAHGQAKGAQGRSIGYGYDHIHSAVDDRSRAAFCQISPMGPRPG